MKFALTFAALALSTTEAAKLKTLLKAKNAEALDSEEGASPSKSTLTSVNSLAKAYEFHQKEQQILESINQQLSQYWKAAEETKVMLPQKKAPVVAQVVQTKVAAKAKVDTKTKAKAKVAVKAAVKVVAKAKVQEKPKEPKKDQPQHFLTQLFDDSNVQIEEKPEDNTNVQMEAEDIEDNENIELMNQEIEDDYDLQMMNKDLEADDFGEEEDADVQLMNQDDDFEDDDEVVEANDFDGQDTAEVQLMNEVQEEKAPLMKESLVCNGKTCEVKNVPA